MALDFSISPYFDDHNESKLFQQILFKPGYAVQARELTQLQTILQNQVSRLGHHMFDDGSLIIPGGTFYDDEYHYVKVDSSYMDPVTFEVFNAETYTADQLIGATVTGTTSGVTATIVNTVTAEGTDPVTLFVKYTGSGNAGTDKVFLDAEELTSTLGANPDIKFGVDTTGDGSAVMVDRGVYFVHGRFALVEAQTIILEKYLPTPTNRVGFHVIETAVSSNDDTSLLDNANGGYSNYNAPGADRFKIELTLAKYDISSLIEADFVELMQIRAGAAVNIKERSTFNLISDALAAKTHDESGDYTIRPFITTTSNHATDGTKLTLNVAPGKAVIDGNTFEKTDSVPLNISKPRSVVHNDDVTTAVRYSNYVPVDNISGVLPDFRFFPKVEIKDSTTQVIGTARVRNIEYVSGTGTATKYNLYIFDVNMYSGVTNNFRTAYTLEGISGSFACDVDAAAASSTIFGIDENTALFPTPIKRVKDTKTVGGSSTDTTITYMNFQEVIVGAAASTVNVSVVNNTIESFPSIEESDWIIVPSTGSSLGVPVDPAGITYATGDTEVTIDLGGTSLAGETLRVWSKIRKSGTSYKTKTLVADHTHVSTWSASTNYPLPHADGWTLKSVINDTDSADITHMFNFDGGQRENFYDVAYLNLKPQYNVGTSGTTFTVTFDYFSHSAGGDYFTIDSYPANIDYEDIPQFGSVDLRDTFDLRPRIDDSASDFSSAGAARTAVLALESTINHDAHYYLPRTDALYIDNAGEFGIVSGADEVSGTVPRVPGNAMKIYEIVMPGYVIDSSDLSLRHVDNRRFTMSDIGIIEDRVDVLEYHTTLTNLEQQTLNATIADSTGTDRWKSGFMVDTFVDHTKTDSTPDNAMAIDPQTGELRPSFNEKNVRLVFDSGTSTGVVKKGDMVMLPYSSVSAIDQPYASETSQVNPHSKYGWEGTMQMSPASDEWNDRETSPLAVSSDINILSTFNSHNWNNWEWNWAGSSKAVNTNRTGRLTHSRALVDSIAISSNDEKISIAAIPTIRSRKVYFKIDGLKPSTKYYAFFDGVDVNDWVREEPTYVVVSDSDVQYGNEYKNAIAHPDSASALTTNGDGEIIGSFFIPNTSAISFRAGDRKFNVTDDPNNSDILQGAGASFTYRATGNLLNPSRSTRPAVEFDDHGIRPLSQIFNVESSEGMFATKIDLYFESKGASDAPVTLQIRTVELGIPTGNVVPMAQATVKAADVNVSDDATSSTLFEFDAPVYLEGGREYAIVLVTDTTEYSIWSARTNELALNKNYKVHSQLLVGSIYSDGIDRERNLKFKLHKAAFVTGTTGSVILNNADLNARLLEPNAIQVISGRAELIVHHPNHGLHEGSAVTISGVDADIGGIAIADINRSHTVTEAESDIYRIDSSSNAHITAATSSEYGGGSAIMSTENAAFNTMYPYIEDLVLSGTTLSWDHQLTTGKSLGSTESPYNKASTYTVFTPNTNHAFENSMLVASGDNEAANMASDKSLSIRGTLSTDNANISPIVDLDRASVFAINNRINNPVGGTISVAGQNVVEPFVDESAVSDTSALAKYITKPVKLLKSSIGLNVRMGVNRPEGSAVEVYYRAVKDGEDVDINTLGWNQMSQPESINTDNDQDAFREYEFTADDMDPFSRFAIKVVFKSDNTSAVPRVRDFRVVALGT